MAKFNRGEVKKDCKYAIIDSIKNYRIRLKDGVDKKSDVRIRVQLEDLLDPLEYDLDYEEFNIEETKSIYKKYYDIVVEELSNYKLNQQCDELFKTIKNKLDL